MIKKWLAVLLITGIFTGCSAVSGVRVVKNPQDYDSGIRYYRPKPYLKVSPAEPTGRMVKLSLEYLPDFTEEYSIHARGKTSVSLKDGWNLVGVNTKAEPPKEEPKEEPPLPDLKVPDAVVAASNVPIGYYESVIVKEGETKVFKGWRYIGFTPLAGSVSSGGVSPNGGRRPNNGHGTTCPGMGCPGPFACQTGAASNPYEPLYGLVFFNGAMTFRQLNEIAGNQLCPVYVDPTPEQVKPAAAAGTDAGPIVVPGTEPDSTGRVQKKDDEGGPTVQPGPGEAPPVIPDPNLPPTEVTPPTPGVVPEAPLPGSPTADSSLVPSDADATVQPAEMELPPLPGQ